MTAIIAASILAMFTMSSPAFAYSNVPPRPAPQKLMSTQQFEGHEIKAPRWSFACVNDQDAQQCDQPEWVYGSPDCLAQF